MIAILDYGMGNLMSVEKAFKHIGRKAIITNIKQQLSDASAIVIPGVGAFPDAMESLISMGLREEIKDYARRGKAIVGICLGMQLLFEKGYENVPSEGFGLLTGEVKKIPSKNVKIPHMGWNRLHKKKSSLLLDGLEGNEYVYFVHSYYAKDCSVNQIVATTEYSVEMPAIVEMNNIIGLQFHPEKSGDVGLKILDNIWKVVK